MRPLEANILSFLGVPGVDFSRARLMRMLEDRPKLEADVKNYQLSLREQSLAKLRGFGSRHCLDCGAIISANKDRCRKHHDAEVTAMFTRGMLEFEKALRSRKNGVQGSSECQRSLPETPIQPGD